jgi:hypothetical protein
MPAHHGGTAWSRERDLGLIDAVKAHHGRRGQIAWPQVNERLGLADKSQAASTRWNTVLNTVLTAEAKAAAVVVGAAAAKQRMQERDKDIERQRGAGTTWDKIAANGF